MDCEETDHFKKQTQNRHAPRDQERCRGREMKTTTTTNHEDRLQQHRHRHHTHHCVAGRVCLERHTLYPNRTILRTAANVRALRVDTDGIYFHTMSVVLHEFGSDEVQTKNDALVSAEDHEVLMDRQTRRRIRAQQLCRLLG